MKIYIEPSTRVETVDFDLPIADDVVYTSFPPGGDEGDGGDAAAKERDDFEEQFNENETKWGNLW